MSGLELVLSERRNLGFWGDNYDVDPCVSSNFDNGLLEGTGIIVDPRDSGQLALLNGVYRNRVSNIVNTIDDAKRAKILGELKLKVSENESKINILGKQTKALHGMINDIITARDYSSLSVAGTMSEIASTISGVLYKIPAVNIVWASTFGIASSVLEWYVESEASDMMKRTLSLSRSLFLDNVMTNLLEEKMDATFRNIDDNASKIEKLDDWLNKKNEFFKEREMNGRLKTLGNNLYGKSFFTSCDPNTGENDQNTLGIILPEISDHSPTLRYGLVDLESKTFNSDVIRFGPNAMHNATESLRYQFMAKDRKKRMKYAGTVPYMADEDVIVRRFDGIRNLLSDLKRGFDAKDISRSILQLFQSGKK